MVVFFNSGQIHVFGRGDSGQLGLPSSDLALAQQKAVKLTIPDDPKVKSIACGAAFSLAVTEDDGDNLWGWGYGEMGQLSNGSADSDEPFNVALKGRRVIDAAGGGQHTLLLIAPKVESDE
jgi:regulator of chromosome condensation